MGSPRKKDKKRQGVNSRGQKYSTMNDKDHPKDSQLKMMSKASSSNILAEQSQFKGPRNSMVYKRNNKSVQSTRA